MFCYWKKVWCLVMGKGCDVLSLETGVMSCYWKKMWCLVMGKGCDVLSLETGVMSCHGKKVWCFVKWKRFDVYGKKSIMFCNGKRVNYNSNIFSYFRHVPAMPFRNIHFRTFLLATFMAPTLVCGNSHHRLKYKLTKVIDVLSAKLHS